MGETLSYILVGVFAFAMSQSAQAEMTSIDILKSDKILVDGSEDSVKVLAKIEGAVVEIEGFCR